MQLEVRNISVHYGRMQAIANISLSVSPGQFVAILGANGAGKTTLLRAVSGLVRPSSGIHRAGWPADRQARAA